MADRVADSAESIPEELARALREAPEAAARFEALPSSHRREYVRWVSESKREETRARRAAQAIVRLTEQRTVTAKAKAPSTGSSRSAAPVSPATAARVSSVRGKPSHTTAARGGQRGR